MRPRGSVLVIEDDSDLSEMVVRALLHRGYVAVSTSDGAAALGALDSFKPDVIVLDLAMAGLDGHGFLAARAERPDLSTIAVIITSGATATRQLAASTWDEFLPKPYALQDLIDAIDRLAMRRYVRR
jgi:DNA-binding response OmpR family regulator